MRLIADTLIDLPFTLDFCSQKPNVDPLFCHLDGTDVTLWFPPSLSDGTDGQGVFGGWAWWTGKNLRIVQQRELAEPYDTEALRATALALADTVLRRFLNAYRWRFQRPDVHPISVDARRLSLQIAHDDGTTETLPEPVSAFFYQNMPTEPPLETSVNKTTLTTLQDDVQQGYDPPLAGQLRLDADALDAQGEHERAELVRSLIAH